MLARTLVLTTLSLLLVGASKVVDLTTENFDSIIGKGRPALVEFYAPWCGHCKNLAPTYELLADAFAHQSERVIIAKTDADGVGKALGPRFGVQGFPTLKWFPANDVENPIDYEGGRDLDSLVAFVAEHSKTKSNIKAPPPPATLELNAGNFDKVVKGGKDVLVAFTAPWCGHCKNMKPAYEKVAAAFKSEPSCIVAGINADAPENKPFAAEYGVASFPTLKFFPKDGGEPVPYSGGRTEEDFVKFLNEHCGTHRTTTGLLSATAGKVLALDTFASQFFSAPTIKRPEILKQAQVYLATLQRGTGEKMGEMAGYYLKAMEKILDKGESWLEKETARFAKLVNSPSLAPTKLDELIIKKNILSAFVHSKIDEAVASGSSVVAQATEAIEEKVKEIREEL